MILYRYMANGKEEEFLDKGSGKTKNGDQEHFVAMLSPALRKIVAANEWQLGDRQYRDLNAETVFENLKVSEATALWLDLNKKSAILKQISGPRYTRLQGLYLGDNNISSIDNLPDLKAPTLQKLYLNHNKITSLRPFRRVTFTNLVELNLNGNFFEQEQWLVYCNFSKAAKISLSYPNKKQKIWQSAWFIKAQIKKETTIMTRKGRLGNFNAKHYWTLTNQMKGGEPKNLFKTFES